MVSKFFPKTHPKAGQDTGFVQNIRRLFSTDNTKIHTIRGNYSLWENRAAEINGGRGVLSIRYWSGMPYRSKQIEICALEKIGIEKLDDPSNFVFAPVNGKLVNWREIAENDGLSFDDFCKWFKDRSKQPMAIIHFTNFRYSTPINTPEP